MGGFQREKRMFPCGWGVAKRKVLLRRHVSLRNLFMNLRWGAEATKGIFMFLLLKKQKKTADGASTFIAVSYHAGVLQRISRID